MSATLPPEILKEIFLKLNNECNVIRCRMVCKSWKDAVDDLGDSYWKKVCEKSLIKPVYDKIHKKSSIPWRDVYRAVNSWSHAKTAEVSCRVLPAIALKFKLLPHRMIAVLTNSNGDSACGDKGLSDTIIYYDVDTSQEIKRNQYDKPIIKYDENEHLIVILSSDGELTLIEKANNKKGVLGKVLKKYNEYYGGFGLFGLKVYFQNEDSLVSVSKLFRTKDGAKVRKTVTLKSNCYEEMEAIVAFGNMDGKLTILTTSGHALDYDACDEDYSVLGKFKWYHTDILHSLQQYGIDWSAPEVYQWLSNTYKNNIKMSKIQHHSFFLHGFVGLLGTSKNSTVNIYQDAFQKGTLSVYKIPPTKSIDLSKFPETPDGLKDSPINQIDVMESADHHLVFVLTGERVFILNIGFGGTDGTSSPDGTEEMKCDASDTEESQFSTCESEEMASEFESLTGTEEMETDDFEEESDVEGFDEEEVEEEFDYEELDEASNDEESDGENSMDEKSKIETLKDEKSKDENSKVQNEKCDDETCDLKSQDENSKDETCDVKTQDENCEDEIPTSDQ